MLNNPYIGTQKESSLHRALKVRYTGSEGDTETVVGQYLCDGRTGKGELIEVQCGSFGPLKEKVKKLARENKVRVIHPIIAKKYIELYDVQGCLLRRRKSPLKGSDWDVFKALVHAPKLPLLKNLTIELAIIESVEKRTNDGKGSWRRCGVSKNDHLLDAWCGSIVLKMPKDYYRFIPFAQDEPFTTRELAEKAGINKALAQKTLYVLTQMGLAERRGIRGRTNIFVRI